MAQVDKGCALAAFVLGGFGEGGDVGVGFEELAEGAAENAHAGAVDDADAGQAGEEGAVDVAGDFVLGFLGAAADDVDLGWGVVERFAGLDGDAAATAGGFERGGDGDGFGLSAISARVTRIFMGPMETSRPLSSMRRSTRAWRLRFLRVTRSPTLMGLGGLGPGRGWAGSLRSAPVLWARTVEENCCENSRRRRDMRRAESRAIFWATVLSSMALTDSRSWNSKSSRSWVSLTF